MAKDFYIILNGEVGVFVPRIPHQVIAEMNTVERMMRMLDKTEANSEQIKRYVEAYREDKDKKDFLSKVLHVYDGNKIIMTDAYLTEKLGGLPYQTMQSEIFFNPVNLIITKARLLVI